MRRYFFHVLDGVTMIDRVGEMHVDDSAAYLAALRKSPDLLKQSFDLARSASDDWRLEVRDEANRIIATVRFLGVRHAASNESGQLA